MDPDYRLFAEVVEEFPRCVSPHRYPVRPVRRLQRLDRRADWFVHSRRAPTISACTGQRNRLCRLSSDALLVIIAQPPDIEWLMFVNERNLRQEGDDAMAYEF